MSVSSKYFHDRTVLSLLTVNIFLALATSIFILLQLGSNDGNGYIDRYRPSLGIERFSQGNAVSLLSFIGFSLMVLAIHSLLSVRVYRIHRQLAIVVLSLGILLLILTFIISNALLVLH